MTQLQEEKAQLNVEKEQLNIELERVKTDLADILEKCKDNEMRKSTLPRWKKYLLLLAEHGMYHTLSIMFGKIRKPSWF